MELLYKVELPPISFLGGDFQQWEYAVTDKDDGSEADLTYFQAVGVVIFRPGDAGNPILKILGSVVAANASHFVVNIKSSYTKNLEDVYIQQPFLIDSDGDEFRPGQGTVNIIPRGNIENIEFAQ